MRIGFVGAGAITEHHLEVLREQPEVVVAAICDLDEARAGAVAKRTCANAYLDWEEMLAVEKLDALFVCTPPMHHARPAIAALGAGIAVYLEKPLARSLADGRAIVTAWHASETVCAVGYQWRSLDVLGELQALLRVATPGMLVSRSFGPTEGARRDIEGGAAWFADPRSSGGILFELASHDIDLQIALAGPVDSVQATAASGLLALAGQPAHPLDDSVAVLLRFAGGGIGAVHVAWSPAQTPPVYSLDVHAVDVALQLELDPTFELSGRAHGRDVAIKGTVPPRVSTITRFLDAVRSGDPTAVPCTPADALRTLAAVIASEQAITTGERVAL